MCAAEKHAETFAYPCVCCCTKLIGAHKLAAVRSVATTTGLPCLHIHTHMYIIIISLHTSGTGHPVGHIHVCMCPQMC